MKIVAEKVLKKVMEMYPLLKNIKLNLQEYPLDIEFDPETSEYHYYAKLNIKRSKKNKDFHYKVDLFTNMFEYFGEHMYKDSNFEFSNYIKSLNIEFNNKNLLIFNLLHELGHALMYENFRKDTGDYEKLLGYNEACNSIIDIIFSEGCNFNPIDRYHFHELNAEKFAYSTFPVVIANLD